jgi:SAM-dependent methyltransferase
MDNVQRHNRQIWEERARRELPHTEAAGPRAFENPLAAIDPCGWIEGGVRGKHVLCLAAGGGKHAPLFATAGAIVTVVDISSGMLARDRAANVRTIEASMDHLPMLLPGEFEIVIQPVSTCYVPDIHRVYREIARVTAPGGLYISQHKQPTSLQAEAVFNRDGYLVSDRVDRKEPLPALPTDLGYREAGALEFIHSWEDLLGGLCQSGFVIEDVIEPRHAKPDAPPGSFEHRCAYLPPFVTIKARRKADKEMKLFTPATGYSR